MLRDLFAFIDANEEATKYRGMNWDVEIRAAQGDEEAVNEMYRRFDIELFGGPGKKGQVLI